MATRKKEDKDGTKDDVFSFKAFSHSHITFALTHTHTAHLHSLQHAIRACLGRMNADRVAPARGDVLVLELELGAEQSGADVVDSDLSG